MNLKIRTDTNDRLDLLAVTDRWHAHLDLDCILRHCRVQRVSGEFVAYLDRARQKNP